MTTGEKIKNKLPTTCLKIRVHTPLESSFNGDQQTCKSEEKILAELQPKKNSLIVNTAML